MIVLQGILKETNFWARVELTPKQYAHFQRHRGQNVDMTDAGPFNPQAHIEIHKLLSHFDSLERNDNDNLTEASMPPV